MRRVISGIIFFINFQVLLLANVSSKNVGSDSTYTYLHFSDNANQFKNPALTAFRAFNELHDVNITIKRGNINTMMAARPKSNFLFRKKNNREYIVYISNNPDMNANALYKHMSTSAKVGILGHELSHIVSYTKMSNIELLWFGIKYVFNKKEIEAETDIMAVKKGFGEQIIEFNHYLRHSERTNKKYLRKKKKYYLSSVELKQKLQLSF